MVTRVLDCEGISDYDSIPSFAELAPIKSVKIIPKDDSVPGLVELASKKSVMVNWTSLLTTQLFQ